MLRLRRDAVSEAAFAALRRSRGDRQRYRMLFDLRRQSADPGAPESSKAAIYNTLDPVQALATMETMTLEAVFLLKDFHRHMESAVVVRRLRDVGQKFSTNRRTLILTAPSISMPPEL